MRSLRETKPKTSTDRAERKQRSRRQTNCDRKPDPVGGSKTAPRFDFLSTKGFKRSMLQKLQEASMGHSKLYNKKCLQYLSTLSLSVGYILLLFYALIWEAGNIVNLPNKKIGFYNFCLWNNLAEELQCLKMKELEEMGIHYLGMVLSRVSVYSSLVFCLFGSCTIFQAQCWDAKEIWVMTLFLLAGCVVALSGGLGLFLFETWHWIDFSDLGGGFLALAGAQALLLLQLFTTGVFLRGGKGSPSLQTLAV